MTGGIWAHLCCKWWGRESCATAPELVLHSLLCLAGTDALSRWVRLVLCGFYTPRQGSQHLQLLFLRC